MRTFTTLAILLGLLLPAGTVAAPSSVGAGKGTPLTLEARVACQRAIEEGYWQHRLWPAENPQPKPALEPVMPLGQHGRSARRAWVSQRGLDWNQAGQVILSFIGSTATGGRKTCRGRSSTFMVMRMKPSRG